MYSCHCFDARENKSEKPHCYLLIGGENGSVRVAWTLSSTGGSRAHGNLL